MAATASSASAGFEDGAAYCKQCKIWLNGRPQWEGHLAGKKHRGSLKRLQRDASTRVADRDASTLADQEAPPGFIRIRLLALSGSTVGSVLCRSQATWQEVAAAILNALPTAVPVPPSNARTLSAEDLRGGVQVLVRMSNVASSSEG